MTEKYDELIETFCKANWSDLVRDAPDSAKVGSFGGAILIMVAQAEEEEPCKDCGEIHHHSRYMVTSVVKIDRREVVGIAGTLLANAIAMPPEGY